ncbi:MAG: hypothetical protein ACRENP_04270 [Longimicrobiales bacterium]
MSIRNSILALALVLSTAACLDLDVVNQNNPDIDRALADPADVEQVIASSFVIWFQTFNSTDMSLIYPQISDEVTTTFTQRGVQWSAEPREPFNNDPQGDQVWIPRRPWDNFSECIANTNDGMRQIKKGMKILTLNPGDTAVTDNTDRAIAFAKLMQGMCLSYLAFTLDQIAAATEDTIVPAGYDDQRNWERSHLKPYSEIAKMAMASLDEAIQKTTTGAAFVTPATWVNQQQYTNAQIARLAHTAYARLLVYNARTPQERTAVDWQKVLQHTAAGMDFDFGPTLQSGLITSGNWLAFLTNTSTGSEFRSDIQFLGPADQSGAYQTWLAAPRDQRQAFFITTPDRRVTGTTPTSNGAYFRNRNTLANFNVSRGTMHQSYYQWHRRSNYGAFTSSTGQYVMLSADENRLLRAEALLRTGNTQGAVDLINVSRVRGVRVGTTNFATNLPPITTAGVPTVAGACVPRKKSGACGDVMDALLWERRMELFGQDPVRYWADMRGIGALEPGSLLHMPIPGRYLVSLQMPIYTHGGVGGTGAAQ